MMQHYKFGNLDVRHDPDETPEDNAPKCEECGAKAEYFLRRTNEHVCGSCLLDILVDRLRAKGELDEL